MVLTFLFQFQTLITQVIVPEYQLCDNSEMAYLQMIVSVQNEEQSFVVRPHSCLFWPAQEREHSILLDWSWNSKT